MSTGITDLAVGIDKVEIGASGDGVPGVSLDQYFNIVEGSAIFSFPEPVQTPLNIEESDDPLHIILNNDVRSIDFALYGLSAAELAILHGGVASTDKYSFPNAPATIKMTVMLTTKTVGGFYYEYTIVNAQIVAAVSQAPNKTNGETWLIRAIVTEARTAAGVLNTPVIREKQTA